MATDPTHQPLRPDDCLILGALAEYLRELGYEATTQSCLVNDYIDIDDGQFWIQLRDGALELRENDDPAPPGSRLVGRYELADPNAMTRLEQDLASREWL